MPKRVPMPTEFAEFLRDIGIRSFDHLSDKLTTRGRSTGISALARRWAALSKSDKEKFFKLVISTGEAIIAAAPAVVAGAAAMRKPKTKTEKATEVVHDAAEAVGDNMSALKSDAKKISKKVAKKIMKNK